MTEDGDVPEREDDRTTGHAGSAAAPPEAPERIAQLLLAMGDRQASDLFLTTGRTPRYRIAGVIQEQDLPILTEEEFAAFTQAHLSPLLRRTFEETHDLDVGVSLRPTERFRINFLYEKSRPGLVARRVPSGALSFDSLRLPPVLGRMAGVPRGLVLITGATGSGKSTTMAAILHHINQTYAKHIITIEDPVEFVHDDVKSFVSQREVGSDTESFTAALRHVVRQSPDVIIVGEMRDLDTISTAITAALTGHLVISTLHTADVSQTLERIVNYYPEHLRDQVALDLSMGLAGVVAQRLVPLKDGTGRVPAVETLWMTPLARRLIAERRLEDIEEVIKAGENEGMQTFNRALAELYGEDLITAEVGAAAAGNREEFLLAIQGMETGIATHRGGAVQIGERKLSIRSLLRAAVRNGASDLLISSGRSPMLRIDGDLFETTGGDLAPQDTERLLFSILTPHQRATFEAEREIDLALSIHSKETDDGPEVQRRFRVNGFYQRGHISCALRVIQDIIPKPEDLGLPRSLVAASEREHGLILVTGPTGHGKTTTLASLVDHINRKRACHIITVEDPIEYVHGGGLALIEQREVHADTKSFSNALKYILRQDPDVIMVGEMRDQETIGAALTAAETGHLVMATLHTNDAVQTIDRIIDVFPSHHQNQIRAQLAASLLGVFAQRLVPRRDGQGRMAVFEVMVANTAVKALVRDQKTHQIPSAIETGAKEGMVTFERALRDLYDAGTITRESFFAITGASVSPQSSRSAAGSQQKRPT